MSRLAEECCARSACVVCVANKLDLPQQFRTAVAIAMKSNIVWCILLHNHNH